MKQITFADAVYSGKRKQAAANVAGVTQADKLLRGEEIIVGADEGYTDVEKRPEHEGLEAIWQHVVVRTRS